MPEVLSLSYRPKTFGELVGQEKFIQRIQGHMKKRKPKVLMFVGETGAGKTTVARIIALSLQCKHQEAFGFPCKKCRKRTSSFDISEINASDVTGIDEMRRALQGVEFYPKDGSRYRVYILDELHMVSKSTQNLLLKILEDSPRTTKFILCTTEPQKILRTLRTRCLTYSLESLKEEGVRTLVKRALKKTGEDKNVSYIKLAEALWENGITSPRLVMMAVEKKLAGADYEEAAQVELSSSFNSKALVRSMVKGDWDGVRKELTSASSEDARSIRASVTAYLKTILLESEEIDDRTEAVARAIHKMCESQAEDSVILANVAASCFEATRIFVRHIR